MRLIKRYPNRKLYDTQNKEYITLKGIAALIRDGQEISIIDHTTGVDLTPVTLTHIILEYEKEIGGVVPRSLLAGLIQSAGGPLASLAPSGARSQENDHLVDFSVARVFAKLNIPTHEDIKRLEEQLDDLAAKLESLNNLPG